MISDFYRRFTTAAQFADEKFAAFLLERDPLAGKLSTRDKQAIITGAITCGEKIAAQLLHGRPDCLPTGIAKRLGIKVTQSRISGIRLVLSTYTPADQAIALDERVLANVNTLLMDAGLAEYLPDPREVLVGHELFHHREFADDQIFSRCYTVELWRIGFYRHQSTISTTGEIAANSCAGKLADISCNSLLLEAAAIYAAGQDWTAWFDRLDAVQPV